MNLHERGTFDGAVLVDQYLGVSVPRDRHDLTGHAGILARRGGGSASVAGTPLRSGFGQPQRLSGEGVLGVDLVAGVLARVTERRVDVLLNRGDGI